MLERFRPLVAEKPVILREEKSTSTRIVAEVPINYNSGGGEGLRKRLVRGGNGGILLTI